MLRTDGILHLIGVESYDIDIKEQKVTVVGNLKPEVVLDRISKTGKATSFWSDEPTAKTDTPPAEAVAVL
jgi:copper chaperone